MSQRDLLKAAFVIVHGSSGRLREKYFQHLKVLVFVFIHRPPQSEIQLLLIKLDSFVIRSCFHLFIWFGLSKAFTRNPSVSSKSRCEAASQRDFEETEG